MPFLVAPVNVAAEEGCGAGEEFVVVVVKVLKDLVVVGKVVFARRLEDELDSAKEKVETVLFDFLNDEREGFDPLVDVEFRFVFVEVLLNLLRQLERLDRFEEEEVGEEREGGTGEVVRLGFAELDVAGLNTLAALLNEVLPILLLLTLLGGDAMGGFVVDLNLVDECENVVLDAVPFCTEKVSTDAVSENNRLTGVGELSSSIDESRLHPFPPVSAASEESVSQSPQQRRNTATNSEYE
jgi:hypothetical protein